MNITVKLTDQIRLNNSNKELRKQVKELNNFIKK